MALQRRYPLHLNPEWPSERLVLDAISLVAERKRSAALRALILLGHSELQKTNESTLTEKAKNGAVGTN